MKEQHSGVGVCQCYQCRAKKKFSDTSTRRFLKRYLNKFRRRNLKKFDVEDDNIVQDSKSLMWA